jgi:hypothetical protein
MCGLSDGVMVTQRPLEALFMVQIHVGQPMKISNFFNAFLPVSEKKLHLFFKDARAIKTLKK